MIPTIEQVDPASLATLQSAVAVPPFFFDPFLLGTLSNPAGFMLLRVSGPDSPTTGDLSYELIVQP